MNSAAELEYKALRDMILKCIDTRDRVMQINAAFAAGILVLATTKDFSLPFVLIYPPISTMLAAVWARNEHKKNLIYLYIRTRLEPTLPGLGWDTWKWSQRLGSKGDIKKWYIIYILLSDYSLFLTVQIIMILIGIYSISTRGITSFDEVLLVLSFISLAVIVFIAVIMNKKFCEAIAGEEPPSQEEAKKKGWWQFWK